MCTSVNIPTDYKTFRILKEAFRTVTVNRVLLKDWQMFSLKLQNIKLFVDLICILQEGHGTVPCVKM